MLITLDGFGSIEMNVETVVFGLRLTGMIIRLTIGALIFRKHLGDMNVRKSNS